VKLVPTEGIIGIKALREAATSELTQIIALVRAALDARYQAAKKPGDPYSWFDVEALYPERVIVCKDGRYWQFAYTLDASNQVKLEEPAEVIEQFTPVRESTLVVGDGTAGGIATFLEAVGDTEGKVWDVILVKAGASFNGVFYPDAVLREAVKLFEGARVYVKSDEEHLKKDVKDARQIFGWVSGVKFVEGAAPDTGHLAAKLNVVAGMAALRETIVDAWKRGKKDLVGLSINAYGKVKKSLREAGKSIAQSITRVSSVDLIVDPAAGGGLVRMVEAVNTEEQSEMVLREAMLAAIKAKFPNVDVAALSDEQVLVRYAEAIKPDAPAQNDPNRPATVDELRMVEARAGARTRISGCGLPLPAREKLQKRFDGLARFTEAEVDAEIKAEREYLARFAEGGRVQLEGLDPVQAEDRSKKVAVMLDAFFDPKHKDHAATHSFKECYIEITGDRRVTGRIENMDRSRLAESLGEIGLRESLDSTSLANVLGNSITRRLIADYREMGQWDVWRSACERVPVSDFRSQERTRFGGYGDLPAVAQGAAYLALGSPTDEKATYSPTKRGGTEDLTLEMIKNDDVGVIRRIPVQLSRTAKRTLCKFVLDFVRTNPTLYDSVAFFHATHGNLGSTALDAAALAAARLRMKKQAELNSAARISIGPKFLWVPDDLEETAANLFRKNTNLDKTFVQSLSLEIMPVPYWTDANDWAISADVMDIPGIEVGFLDGEEEPALFVQDAPTVGSMFSNDKLTYKIRHIYGGNVKEYRGWDKSVVA
jgi:hypothetical protein